jgi:sugar porter (SP) family MFS transporter
MAGLYLVSAIGCGLSWSWSSLLFFRILGGAGIGGSSVLGPIYIAEISPAPWRGRLVGVFQINIVIGILTAYLSNYLIALAAFGTREWRWQFGIAALPSLTFLLLLFAIPRSPRWLIKKNRMTEAKHSLIAIGEPNVDRELADIGLSLVLDEEKTGGRLFSRAHRLPIFLGISVAVFSQLSGINAVLYYLNDIFAVAGFTKISSAVQAVVIGLTFLVFTLFAMALIDKAGRRVLLLTGAIGMASTLTGIAAIVANQSHKELLLWLLMVYIASFSFSLGAVTWVYISEVFPTAVRAKGQSLGSLSHWFTNAIISGVFPTLEAKSVAAPFLFFAVMMVIQFFVVLTVYPETKNTSLERLNLA